MTGMRQNMPTVLCVPVWVSVPVFSCVSVCVPVFACVSVCTCVCLCLSAEYDGLCVYLGHTAVNDIQKQFSWHILESVQPGSSVLTV